MRSFENHAEPTVEELRRIEAEWPVEAAYLAVVEAECRFIVRPDVLARRALRRAEVALDRVLVEHENAQRRQRLEGTGRPRGDAA
ncbi:MAG: DUF6284 family protein [Acidimicrobiales bacterium]